MKNKRTVQCPNLIGSSTTNSKNFLDIGVEHIMRLLPSK